MRHPAIFVFSARFRSRPDSRPYTVTVKKGREGSTVRTVAVAKREEGGLTLVLSPSKREKGEGVDPRAVAIEKGERSGN